MVNEQSARLGAHLLEVEREHAEEWYEIGYRQS